EALDSIYLACSHNVPLTHTSWGEVARVVDWVSKNWDRSEEGIWETRGGTQDFVYGRLMSWVALDRAVRLARDLARPADLDNWIRSRDRIYEQIMSKGWNQERQAFVQHYKTQVLDAA